MEMDNKYDPEDIESLMIHKTFEELLDKEKQFVLQHLESSDEYDSMRGLLLGLDEYGDDQITPPPSIKDTLMGEFERKAKLPFWKVWLNSIALFLVPPQKSFAKSPAFALAMIAVIFGSVITFMNPSTPENLAYTEATEPKPSNNSKERPRNENQSIEFQDLEAEDEQVIPQENLSENVESADKKSLQEEEIVLAKEELVEDLAAPEQFINVAEADVPAITTDDYADAEVQDDIEWKAEEDLAITGYKIEESVEESVEEITLTNSAPASNSNSFDLAEISAESSSAKRTKLEDSNNALSKRASKSKDLMDLLYTSL